jgi:transformation/transcription domain-associated protein
LVIKKIFTFRAVQLSSKNVHDESLPTSIQTMSCKLLLNLGKKGKMTTTKFLHLIFTSNFIILIFPVECIRQRSEQESGNGKELLVKMMEVFVLKFKTVSKLHLPVLLAKHRPPPPPPSLSSSSAVPQHAPLTPGPPSLAPMPSPATPGNPQTPATPATPDIKSEADVKPVPSPGPTSSLSQVD